ncbi:MAG: DNA primase [Candidatus Improbicoccus devescovinae]|nr:MAG: DNA primase [Candidatus Improbicoccus devescovinae]
MVNYDELLSKIKEKNNIQDVISSYVNLKQKGKNLVALCPFHAEKTPSFYVYLETESFYCFGCGVGGDVVSFIRLMEKLDYKDAVCFLAKCSGIDVGENIQKNSNFILKKNVIYEINRQSAKFFYSNLISENMKNKKAIEYLLSRKLEFSTVKHFGIGFALNSYHDLVDYLISKGYKKTEILAAGLCVESKNGKYLDRFFNRIMFPIMDSRGNVVAFGGRSIGDSKPKYLNTCDTIVFKKGENLFSLNFIEKIKNKSLILVEGYMDVVSLYQAGIRNVVATLGTALTDKQAQLMARYADTVYVAYDSDTAGQSSKDKAVNLLKKCGIHIKIVIIPEAKDPDEYVVKNKQNAKLKFENLMSSSQNDVEYSIQKIRTNLNFEKLEDRIKFLHDSAKILANINNSLEREVYANKISNEMGIPKSVFLQQIKKNEKSRNNCTNIQKKIFFNSGNVEKVENVSFKTEYVEKTLISCIIYRQDCTRIIEKLKPSSFVTDFARKVFVCVLNLVNLNKKIEITNILKYLSLEEGNELVGLVNTTAVQLTEKELTRYIEILECENKYKKLRSGIENCICEIGEYINLLKITKR